MRKVLNILFILVLLGVNFGYFFVKPKNLQKNLYQNENLENFIAQFAINSHSQKITSIHPHVQSILARNGWRLFLVDDVWYASTMDGKDAAQVVGFDHLPLDRYLDSLSLLTRPAVIKSMQTKSIDIPVKQFDTIEDIVFPAEQKDDTLYMDLNYCGPSAAAIFENTLLHYRTIDSQLPVLSISLSLPSGTEDLSEAIKIINQFSVQKGEPILYTIDKHDKKKTFSTNGKPYLVIDKVVIDVIKAPHLGVLFEAQSREVSDSSFLVYTTFTDRIGDSYAVPTHRGTLP